MKTIQQALIDEILYPIPLGYVENKLIERELDGSLEYTVEVRRTKNYKGALADCYFSLLQSVNISESDKSIGSLTDADKRLLLKKANALYNEIGEAPPDVGVPTVTIGW